MKKYCMLAILLWLCYVSTAQALVQGTILGQDTNAPLVGAHVLVKNTQQGTVTDTDGTFILELFFGEAGITVFHPNYERASFLIQGDTSLEIRLKPIQLGFDTLQVYDPVSYEEQVDVVPITVPFRQSNQQNNALHDLNPLRNQAFRPELVGIENQGLHNTEEYNSIKEHSRQSPWDSPFSTFSIDVDHATYSNARRFINQGQKPPKESIRIEEMINYFDYAYPRPSGETPFNLITEVSDCPWNMGRKLLHIGIKGEEIPLAETPANNLVFLLDVSGSMGDANKLPLVKQTFKLLVDQLRPNDKISIVVYAGAAGLVLPPTSGTQKDTILQALEHLKAGGSTAGGEGIRLAYAQARSSFVKTGNNRVIIATDGDFNIGPSSESELLDLIRQQAGEGIFLSVLGFGMGNYKDNKLELLSNEGDGNYAYIDNLQEGRKVFVQSLTGTLYTIAKDVKVQVEFNPALVKSYRLIGYENRALSKSDFENDEKDAGELGAGHSVTALYELELHPQPVKLRKKEASRYQRQIVTKAASAKKELGILHLRFKQPDNDKSEVISMPMSKQILALDESSTAFKFAASVAGFGLLLRESSYVDWSFEEVKALAESALGKDPFGYRREFLGLVDQLE